MILWQTIHFLYKHWLPNNHKTSALPPLRWVYGQASHFHIQGQQNSVLILGLIFFSLLPKESRGNQFTPQIRYQTAYFVSLSYTIIIQLALTVKWGWSVIGQFHINQWFSLTQAKLKESVNINSGKKGQSTKIWIVILFFIVYQFFIVFTGISLIILFQLVNTFMWLQIRNNPKLFRYFTHQFS